MDRLLSTLHDSSTQASALVIAHRLSTIRHAGTIVVMHKVCDSPMRRRRRARSDVECAGMCSYAATPPLRGSRSAYVCLSCARV